MSGSELYDAAEAGDEKLVRDLIDGGADVNFRDRIFAETPLFAASEKGNTEICKFLIKAGAEIDITNKYGMTVLDAWPKDIYQRRVGAEIVQELIKETNTKLLLSTGSRPVDTVKLFLIGHPSTGKTTLRKSLSRGPVEAFFTEGRASTLPHDPTPGIKVKLTTVKGAGSIMFWDMAGHVEFRVTHAMLFGSSRGIALLTYNCCDTEEEQLQQLRYWLCFIKAGNDPNNETQKQVIILVGTHVDECKQKDKAGDCAARKIQHEFKDVFHIHDDIFLLNCCKSGGLRTLITAIGELAKPMREELMPKICDDIIKHKKQWCEGKAPVLRFSQFAQKVRELLGIIDTVNDISDKLLRTAVGFLHDMGEVHHVSFGASDDIIIIEPDWLTSTIFGPIFAEPGFKDVYWALESKTEYTVEELASHFKNVDPNILIDLLIHFELAFCMERCDGQRTFIIPTKLPHDTDGKDSIYWHDHSRYGKIHGIRLQCRDKTDIFSDDTFPCLQVRAMNRYRQEGVTPVLSRFCLKLLDEEVEGIIQLTEDKRAVHVAVRVPRERMDQGQNGVDQLQEMQAMVFSQLKQRSAGTKVDILYLSSNDLRETIDVVKDVHVYTEEMVHKAQVDKKPLKHPVKLISELVENVKVPGVSPKLKIWRSVLQTTMDKLTSQLDPSKLVRHLDIFPEILYDVIGDTQSKSQSVANATVLLKELLQTQQEDWPENLLRGLREANQENVAEIIGNEYLKQTSESSQLESVSCNIEETSSESPQPPKPLGVSSLNLTTRRKCVLVGDGGSGKTSLYQVFSTGRCPTDWESTVMEHYQVQMCVYGNQVELEVFDTAGLQGYERLLPLSFPEADEVLILFSIANLTSLENVLGNWIPEVKKHRPDLPIMLVGLKMDLRNDEDTIRELAKYKQKPIQPEEGHAMARKIGAVCYLECSSLTGVGVRHVFNTAAKIAFQFREKKTKKKSEKRRGGRVRKI